MKFSRRALLAGVSTIALTKFTTSNLVFGEAAPAHPNAAAGRINLGLCEVADYFFFHPFINVLKIARGVSVGFNNNRYSVSKRSFGHRSSERVAISRLRR
jgi:hypothetical protein